MIGNEIVVISAVGDVFEMAPIVIVTILGVRTVIALTPRLVTWSWYNDRWSLRNPTSRLSLILLGGLRHCQRLVLIQAVCLRLLIRQMLVSAEALAMPISAKDLVFPESSC